MTRSRPGNRLTNIIIVVVLGLTILFVISSVIRVRSQGDPAGLSPEGIKVEVLNGCGESGVAGQIRRLLQDSGFDVVRVDNAEVFTYPITLVKDRRGNRAAAHLVAEALGRLQTIQALDEGKLLDVTVVVGRDYRQILYPAKQSWSDKTFGFMKKD
ncbi:LytR C-terminal domain-containing protein [candidate division KSB1 bacterium]